MPFSFWSILIAGLLPYAATLVAKSRPDFDNANPRAWLATLDGFRARAHAGQLNSFEAFPFFAAAVIVAHLRGAQPETMNLLCIGFIAARVAYIAFYLANLATLRSLVWLVGIGFTVALFFIS